ncbi:MAG TPA: hypothetical protein VK249_27315 [Anaerolineales bacterium]|nr:hypothetical protein [Anaerolineales bacterium]
METIVAALISAITAVLVVLINRKPVQTRELSSQTPKVDPKHNQAWAVLAVIGLLWLVISTALLTDSFENISRINTSLIIPVITLGAAFLWIIDGWIAFAIVVILHIVNVIAYMGVHYGDVTYYFYGVSGVIMFALIVSINAILVVLILRLRRAA